MKNVIFFLLAATLFPAKNYAVGRYGQGDTLNVLALSGLRLRDKPGGAVVAILPYGAQIIMREYRPCCNPDTVENIPGQWAKAVWQGKEGYVFDGFLSLLPAPDERIESLSAYCERYFTKMGSPIEVKFGEEESTNDIGIQFYIYRNLLFEMKTNGYYEGWSETLTIDPGYEVSSEEMFLLLKAIYRKNLAESLEKIETGGFTPDEVVQPPTRPLDKNYYRFVPLKDCGQVDYYLYPEACLDGIRIGQFGYMIFVQRWGGC